MLGTVSTWMSDCLRTGKPYVTNHQGDSAFYSQWDSKMSISFLAK